MAVIYIKDLIVEAKHGVHPHEKENAQRFQINAELIVDITKAAVTDDLNDTINYSEVRDTIIDTLQNNSFNLLERLSQEVADQILQDKRVEKLTLTIDKLDAFESGVPALKVEYFRSA